MNKNTRNRLIKIASDLENKDEISIKRSLRSYINAYEGSKSRVLSLNEKLKKEKEYMHYMLAYIEEEKQNLKNLKK